jgi:hypothetical protein
MPRHRPFSLAVGLWSLVTLGMTLACVDTSVRNANGGGDAARDSASIRSEYRDSMPACQGCTIELRQIAAFGGLTDSILLRAFPRVEVDGRSRIYAYVPLERDPQLVVYSGSGETLRTLGQVGQGPGEFRQVSALLVIRGDTVAVMHDGRVSFFDQSGAFASSVRFDPPLSSPGMGRLISVTDSGFVTTEYRRADTLALPLHAYDRSGHFVRSFGTREVTDDYNRRQAGGVSTFPRLAYADPDGSYWLVGPGYRLESVMPDGTTRRLIGVHTPPSWNSDLFMSAPEYESHMTARSSASPQEGLSMAIRNVARLNDSLLAVVAQVPKPGWKEIVDAMDADEFSDLSYLERIYDTLIDIVDYRQGIVLARQLRHGTGYLTNDGLYYNVRASELGVIQVELFEVALARR